MAQILESYRIFKVTVINILRTIRKSRQCEGRDNISRKIKTIRMKNVRSDISIMMV